MSKRAILALAACLLSWSAWPVSAAGASTRLVVAYAKPSALRPGAQRTVTLFGAGFVGPSGGPTVAVDGPGIAVSAVRLVSAERLRVTLTVASDAAPGLRDVTVIQPDGSSRTARAALVVTDGRPPKLRGRVRASSSASTMPSPCSFPTAAS